MRLKRASRRSLENLSSEERAGKPGRDHAGDQGQVATESKTKGTEGDSLQAMLQRHAGSMRGHEAVASEVQRLQPRDDKCSRRTKEHRQKARKSRQKGTLAPWPKAGGLKKTDHTMNAPTPIWTAPGGN